jgi:type VI secretion system protein ImpF
MPELSHRERLQPSLLDRLTDDERDQQVESREKRVLTLLQLRESVRRDLASLFNSVRLGAIQDLEGFPEAARSVINFGLPDLAGHTASGIKVEKLEQAIVEAIWNFEPRLLRESVKVRLIANEASKSHNSMEFVIEAALWAQPVPLQLYLKTRIDLEDGNVLISDVRQE